MENNLWSDLKNPWNTEKGEQWSYAYYERPQKIILKET